MTDPVADMLARIRNAHMREKKTVEVPSSKFKAAILSALEREGYIRGYDIQDDASHQKKFIVQLKYFNGRPVIRDLKRISKPSVQIYTSLSEMKPVANGLGSAILSTSLGVLSDREARDRKVGGKILLTVK